MSVLRFFLDDNDNTMSFMFSDDNSYRNPAEVSCAVCEKPIRWCLDAFSFTTGVFGAPGEPRPFTLAHASCLGTT